MIHEHFHLEINYFMHFDSLPLILASYNRLVVTFLSYFNNVHNSMIAVQSFNIIPQKNFQFGNDGEMYTGIILSL